MEIVYAFHPTRIGECLLPLTSRGICFLNFVNYDHQFALEQLRLKWVNASIFEHPVCTRPVVAQVIALRSDPSSFPRKPGGPALHLHGTNFQTKVWKARQPLPLGSTNSYEGLAEQVGLVNFTRVVGNAVARNSPAYPIPCHRVLQKAGGFGYYFFGMAPNQAILLREAAWMEA